MYEAHELDGVGTFENVSGASAGVFWDRAGWEETGCGVADMTTAASDLVRPSGDWELVPSGPQELATRESRRWVKP